MPQKDRKKDRKVKEEHSEPKEKKIVEQTKVRETIQSVKRPLKDYSRFLPGVKFRFLKKRFEAKDDDLFTKKEFDKMKKKMYGKGG